MSPELERIESLKAGAIAAFGAVAVHTTAVLIRAEPLSLVQFGVGEAIALMCGGLFGVTYRYIVRRDENPQLKSGAVSAFALVRGLSQLEGTIDNKAMWPATVPVLVESVALFAIAQALLEVSLKRGWLNPFGDEASFVALNDDRDSSAHGDASQSAP